MTEDELQNEFAKLAVTDSNKALSLITGLFVGLVECLAAKNGCNPNGEIKIEAAYHQCRDIILKKKS